MIELIEIYKNFELIGINPVYSKFTWTRRFSSAGEFQLETHFSPEKFEELAEGNIIYKRNVDEAAIIEQRKVIQTAHDELKLIVSGRQLSCILDRRVFSFMGEIGLGALLSQIVNNNFMAGAGVNRSMVADGFRFIPSSLPNFNVSADYRNHSAYSAITSLCEEHGLGVKVRYNLAERTFDLMFLQADESDVVFSKEFANVLEQNYRDDASEYRNVVYVGEQFVHNDAAFRGLTRREMFVSAPREATHFVQTALDALHENGRVQMLSSTVNPHSEQFRYMQDWDIGSIVTSRSAELGVSERAIVSEIVEIYGEEGLSLVVKLD